MVWPLTADSVTLSLVNVNQLQPRTVLLQAGGFGEHRWTNITDGATRRAIDSPILAVHLEPGAGARLTLGQKRYVNKPTLALPW